MGNSSSGKSAIGNPLLHTPLATSMGLAADAVFASVQRERLQQLREIQDPCSRITCMQPISAWTSRESSQGKGRGGDLLHTELLYKWL